MNTGYHSVRIFKTAILSRSMAVFFLDHALRYTGTFYFGPLYDVIVQACVGYIML